MNSTGKWAIDVIYILLFIYFYHDVDILNGIENQMIIFQNLIIKNLYRIEKKINSNFTQVRAYKIAKSYVT